MAWVSARCWDGGETAFCAVRRSARGCVRRLSTRARSVCPSSGRGVAALFAYAQFLAAGFCKSDPSRHAGAASPARGCSRPSWSRSTTRGNSGAFEYGWVRGIGSAAFIAGVLVAGQSAAVWGLPRSLVLAAGLFATALSTRFVPDLAPGTNSTTQKRKMTDGDWLVLLYSPYSCVWFSRPLLLLEAMRCTTRSPSYAGVMPESPLLFRAYCGRNRSERRCWYLSSLVPGY